MDALILASDRPESTIEFARPIAGAPLLARQLEWLQACGVRRVAINRVSSDPLPKELNASVLERTGLKVVWIPTGEPLDATALGLRIGVDQYPRALYGRTKSLRSDARLLAGLILGAASGETQDHE